MIGAEALLGSAVVRVPAGVEFHHRVAGEGRARLRLSVASELSGLSTGRFAEPCAGVTWCSDAFAPGIEFVGFAYTQFALPVVAGAVLDFEFRPAPGLRSPPVVLPLLARGSGGSLLLAPLHGHHEQVIAVDDAGLTWGWHGDLDRVPAGFSIEAGLYTGASVSELLARWSDDLGVMSRARSDNPLLTHLSYWTDNGAAYWYRTEPDRTIAESIADKLGELSELDVPVRAVELDSWFYRHELPREIRPVGYPDEVPPTGAMSWTARPDAFPDEWADGGDPLEHFAASLGWPPLVLHARHVSPSSPDVDAAWWVGEYAALPSDPTFFRRWFDDARRWGAVCIEQDWMMVTWFGNRTVRSAPGRSMAWQRGLDTLAGEYGIDLLWCMATPADLVAAAHLGHVIAVRTCDDYRFADDPAFLWTWFLTVNRLAATLGLAVFKDCFFSNPAVDDGSDPIDGDPHAELEALLSALSGGPVGIGDRLARTDREIVLRTCDADGRLRLVDGPIGLIDDCMFGGPARGEGLAWATTTATADGRTWTYVLAINTAVEQREIADRRPLADLGVTDGAPVWEWRRRRFLDPAPSITAQLAPRDWALFVCCPVSSGALPGDVVGDLLGDVIGDVVGDPGKYVTMPAEP